MGAEATFARGVFSVLVQRHAAHAVRRAGHAARSCVVRLERAARPARSVGNHRPSGWMVGVVRNHRATRVISRHEGWLGCGGLFGGRSGGVFVVASGTILATGPARA